MVKIYPSGASKPRLYNTKRAAVRDLKILRRAARIQGFAGKLKAKVVKFGGRWAIKRT